MAKQVKSDGGPSAYYDFPFHEWTTVNDMAEHLADTRWGKHGIHLKEVFKACVRWSGKRGTDQTYDARKIIYYGARLLMWVAGVEETRKALQSLLDHPQFGGQK